MIGQVTGVIWSQAVIDQMLLALHTLPTAVILATPNVGLYTDNHVADPVGDDPTKFTIPTWAGYAPVVIASYFGPVNRDLQDGRNLVCDADFECTGPGTGYSVANGIYIWDGASKLYGQAQFVNPVPVAKPGDSVTLDFLLSLLFRQGT